MSGMSRVEVKVGLVSIAGNDILEGVGYYKFIDFKRVPAAGERIYILGFAFEIKEIIWNVEGEVLVRIEDVLTVHEDKYKAFKIFFTVKGFAEVV